MDTVDIASLLELPEGETLDFKATMYDTSDKKNKWRFAKDIASLANTPREANAYIVLGVKKQTDGSVYLWGLDRTVDDVELQDAAKSLLDPVPRFLYKSIQHDGKVLGLITILRNNSPVTPSRTIGKGFIEGRIYFRRGSQNAEASTQEQGQIWDWFRGANNRIKMVNPYASEPAWSQYFSEVNELSLADRHILIVDACLRDDTGDLSGLGSGPWAFVIDFDSQGDVDGLLASIRKSVERNRALHIRVKDDPSTRRSPQTTTWFFVRGLEGRVDSTPPSDNRTWRRQLRQVVREEIDRLARELSPATTYVTILWRDREFQADLAEVLRSLDDHFQESFRPVFITDVPTVCKSVAEEYDAPIIEMPMHHLARGIMQATGSRHADSGDTIALPSASGVTVPLDPDVASWVSEEIELVPLGDPKVEMDGAGRFLRGGTVTWAEVDQNVDADRDIRKRLTNAVQRDLEDGRTTRFNLFHRPGAGGTTVGRRLAWEIHESFPCGILKRTAPLETAARVARIYELTERPVLLIADGTDKTGSELDELADRLRAGRTPSVLLQVRRRQQASRERGDRTFDLDSQLSDREVNRFVYTLSRDVPDRSAAIEMLGKRRNRASHRPVYFALAAYEEDFRGLPEFVASRIFDLNSDQAKALVYAAVALRYGQASLPTSTFRGIFGLSPGESIEMPQLFPSVTEELFVEITPGEWRIGHWLVADELLQQLLARGDDRRLWRNRLADCGIEFIGFSRGDLPVPSDEMLDVIRRVFVYREDLEVLGSEQSGQRRFSQFIQDIPSSEGKLRVLNALVEAYPEEDHFQAHLARFHAIERKDFAAAMLHADHAVSLSDSDPLLYHMRGMVRRYELRQLQQEDVPLRDLVSIAELASSDFYESRMLKPDNEHGYIAEAQMLIELLDYVAKISGDLFRFIGGANVPPYLREALDRIEALLAHVRRGHEGVGVSQYERRASVRVSGLYGDYSSAIQQLNSLTERPDVYRPPLRRQLARAYLARAGGDWSHVEKRQLDRVVQLLAMNLDEEPRDNQNILLWMQASRFQARPPTIDNAFEQVQYWRAEPGSADAAYYAYVLNALMMLDGSRVARDRYEQYLAECRELTRFWRNRDRSYEWLGDGPGIARLVHHSRLGDWNRQRGFWKNTEPLTRVHGRVASVNGPQAGYIELARGLRAFFVPARSGLSRGNENTPVAAFLGFSYDGLRAWDVERSDR